MVTLTLKQVPAEVLEQLRKEAQRNRRSLNQQAIVFLEQALNLNRVSFGETLGRFYQEVGRPEVGDAEIFEDVRDAEAGREVSL